MNTPTPKDIHPTFDKYPSPVRSSDPATKRPTAEEGFPSGGHRLPPIRIRDNRDPHGKRFILVNADEALLLAEEITTLAENLLDN